MTATGHCYCGKVRWELDPSCPVFAAYCHCESCRRSHAAPMYWVAYVAAKEVTIHGKEWTKSPSLPTPHPVEGFARWFCTECGTRTFITQTFPREVGPLAAGPVIGVFPATFDSIPSSFQPQMHIFCSEAVLDLTQLDDGLLKHATFPSE